MENYIISIKDLVTQTMTDVADIKAKAENGDPKSCFKMGMFHLLGINTPPDFKKASFFFGNKSLSDNAIVNRLLGFIAEYECLYSDAFGFYAKASEEGLPFLNKVAEERIHLQNFFKGIGLPDTVLNKDISTLLNNYYKGYSSLDTKIKMASICEDERSCIEAANELLKIGDSFSALSFLQYGKVEGSNPIYASVKSMINQQKDNLLRSKSMDIFELGNSQLLENTFSHYPAHSIKSNCNAMSNLCKQEWEKSISQIIESIKNTLNEEEKVKLQLLREEETEKQRKKQEEAAARQRRLQEEEITRQKKFRDEQEAVQLANYQKYIKNIKSVALKINAGLLAFALFLSLFAGYKLLLYLLVLGFMFLVYSFTKENWPVERRIYRTIFYSAISVVVSFFSAVIGFKFFACFALLGGMFGIYRLVNKTWDAENSEAAGYFFGIVVIVVSLIFSLTGFWNFVLILIGIIVLIAVIAWVADNWKKILIWGSVILAILAIVIYLLH